MTWDAFTVVKLAIAPPPCAGVLFGFGSGLANFSSFPPGIIPQTGLTVFHSASNHRSGMAAALRQNGKLSKRMNLQINKMLFPRLSPKERRELAQIVLVVLMSVVALSMIVVVGLHKLRHLPVRPPSLFD
jgi:hypothetical protein